MRDKGHDVFIDVNSIRIGDPWASSIEKNISECDIFIVILTPDAITNENIEKEVLQAQKENKIIVPCIHEYVDYKEIKWGLANIQGIEFSNQYQLVLNLYPKIKNYDTSLSQDVNALHEKGRSLYMESKFQDAIDYFDKVLKIDANHIDALFDKGRSLYQQHKFEEAIDWFDNALRVKPTYVQVLNKKGNALHNLGKYPKAIECYDKVLEINPNNTSAQKGKKDALNYLPQEKNDFSKHPQSILYLRIILSIVIVFIIVSIIAVTIFFPFNNLPIANAGSNQTVDSGDIVILNGNKSKDSDGNIISYLWTQTGEEPKVELNDPYTSHPSFRAPIVTSDTKLTFTLTVKDNKDGNSNNFALVNITLKAVNDSPIANNQTIISNINKSVNITLTAYDPQRNDTVTAQIVSPPSNGSLSEINQETGLIIYTPNSGFTGVDKFTYKVNDGKVDSKSAGTINIAVNPNHPPKPNNQSYTTVKNKAIEIILTAYDEDTNDTVTAQIVTPPPNGKLSEINQETGLVIYIPKTGFTGTDKFTYKVHDGKVDSNNVGNIQINVITPAH
jgi:tetratricopeptide (TPR) repeat protein